MVVAAEADRLQAVGSDLDRVLDEFVSHEYGVVALTPDGLLPRVSVAADPVNLEEALGNHLERAAVAEDEVPNAGVVEAAAVAEAVARSAQLLDGDSLPQLDQVRGEDQRVDAAQLLLSPVCRRPVVARRHEDAVADDQLGGDGVLAEVDAGEVRLVLEGSHAYAGQGVAVAEVDALEAVAGPGDLLRGERGGLEEEAMDEVEEALALGLLARVAVPAVGRQEAAGDLPELAAVLEREVLDGDAVEGAVLDDLEAGRERERVDGGGDHGPALGVVGERVRPDRDEVRVGGEGQLPDRGEVLEGPARDLGDLVGLAVVRDRGGDRDAVQPAVAASDGDRLLVRAQDLVGQQVALRAEGLARHELGGLGALRLRLGLLLGSSQGSGLGLGCLGLGCLRLCRLRRLRGNFRLGGLGQLRDCFLLDRLRGVRLLRDNLLLGCLRGNGLGRVRVDRQREKSQDHQRQHSKYRGYPLPHS